tara:strand:- start:69777 stop:71318 length:1542 start_codon:yes stop_codon:yes gene_type:complete
MIKKISFQVTPDKSENKSYLIKNIANRLSIKSKNINHIEIIKRSIDARRKTIKINLLVDVYINQNFQHKLKNNIKYQDVSEKEKIIIIGAGPAGLFAALKLIQNGKCPIIFERGKDVRKRRRDLVKIMRENTINENSNYCFGEGGAGTYSDGKLYTRSKKRGDVNEILDFLIEHGADQNIKVNAHPHIGTNKLPKIISSIRNTIEKYGGKINFNSKLIDIKIEKNKIKSIIISNGVEVFTEKIILATGHSARDIFYLLNKKNIKIELKTFAVGVRIEHPQKLIDKIQYKTNQRCNYLPAASYSLVKQINNRGVYSFCMCPGGVIAPCATKNEEIVTNGWSPSQRNYPTANSGIVVELKIDDFKKYSSFGPLAGVEFQKNIEKKAYSLSNNSQKAPAQKLLDFMKNKLSNNIPKTSYVPGTVSVNISDIFPEFIISTLKNGLIEFDKQMKGYLTNEAVVHAPETRTSSPVRIPRDKKTLQHPDIKGLFPCGEGAGYAGGIMSAAIDGIKCANMC